MATASAETRIGLINPLIPIRAPREGDSSIFAQKPQDWQKTIDELLRIRTLGEDWDGQGASGPAPANVDAALNWVNQMRAWDQAICPTKVMAGADGEMHLVWQNDSLYLDAEIATPNAIAWLVSIKGQATRQWKTDLAQTWLVGSLE